MQQVVIFARVSSQEPEGELTRNSIDTQLQPLREYTNAENLSVLNEYIEVRSEDSKNRPLIGAMFEFLETKVDCEIVLQNFNGRIMHVDQSRLQYHLIIDGLLEWARDNDTTELEAGLRDLGMLRRRFKK